MTKRLKRNDWILIGVLCIAAGILLVVFLTINNEPGSVAEISVDGDVYGTYDLSEDQTITIRQKDEKENVITIQDGKVSMKDASCPDKLCQKQGEKSLDKETIVCLPNKVTVTVHAQQSGDYDTMAN